MTTSLILDKGDRVWPSTPAMFAAYENSSPTNRLQFAQALVNGRNPLVARVVVNRLWQSCFGEGLVRTPGDFGRQGAQPTHPELLDWLACELVENGWNLRAIHRLIVTSSTYRQSAQASATRLLRNPIAATDSARIQQAFQLALGRLPVEVELARFLEFLHTQREQFRNERAVWTSVASVLLNLDEFLCQP